MLEITSKGGNAINAFTAVSKEIPPGSPDIEKVVDVFGANEVEFDLYVIEKENQ